MPLYFFHVMDGRAIVDNEGTDLSGIAEAREVALKTAGSILADEGTQFWNGHEWRMTVADDKGDVFFTLRFAVDDHGK